MTVTHLTIVVASDKRALKAEARALVAELPIEVLAPSEVLDNYPGAPFEGDDLEAYAVHRARHLAEHAQLVTVAEAAGLEVASLGGRPGVRSPRFAREGATDAENNAELLRRLDEMTGEDRRAQFRSVLAVVDPYRPGEPLVVEATCPGRIARKPSGAGGFGYDSLFIVDGVEGDRTLAELTEEETERVSHRHQALRLLAAPLDALLRQRLAEAHQILSGQYEPPPSSQRW